MVEDRVTVASPCTISNLGSGFDIFGMALREPEDVIEARIAEGEGISVEEITGPGSGDISSDPLGNSAAVAAAEVLTRAGADFGLTIKVRKGVRPYSGIGSSGASAAGGAYAANLLLDDPLPMRELVIAAAKAEEIVCGGFHADNVGPALMGGFTLIRSYEPFEIIRITPPRNLGVVVCMPDVMVSTRKAREVLPRSVSLSELIFHTGHASSLAVGMRNGDIDLIGRSMRDMVIEPARARLNPHLLEAKRVALESGAAGSFLGGSGPCVIAIFNSDYVDGQNISCSLVDLYSERGIKAESWVTTWGSGCRRLD